MGADALDRLEACQNALIGAFDSHRPEAIEAAAADYCAAVEDVRQAGSWAVGPELKARLAGLLVQADEAQRRVNFLTDIAKRRQQALGALRGRRNEPVYTRRGV